MGLLDALGSGSGGGLLDFLRNNALNQQFPGMLQSDMAQYGQPMGAMAQAPIMPQQNAQPSPLDNAQWPYGPNGAPSQANAQIPQQPPPVMQAQPMQAMQPQGPGIGDHLMAGMQGFANSGGILPAIANGISGLVTGQRSDPTGVATQQQQQIQNQTKQWLLQRGVDPVTANAAIGQPEVLKSLIEQMKPKAEMSIGQGYMYDPNTKKATRAYEPEDKIPAGFVKGDDGNMHYIPGGPADPAYIQLAEAKKKDPNGVFTLGRGGELYKLDKDGNPVVVHKNEEDGGVPLTPEAIDFAAKRAIAADPKALTNLGRGAQGRADLAQINNRIAEIMKGNPDGARTIMDNAARQAGLVSSSRALGTKETHFGVAEKAMEESLPLAQAASDAVPRSDWMHVNMMMQAGQKEHSNPLVKKFLIANDTAVKDYARTINPTGALRESDIEYARKTLSIADGPEAYTAGLQQLQQEAGVMKRAIQRQKAGLYDGRGEPSAPETTPPQISRDEAEAELRRRGKIK